MKKYLILFIFTLLSGCSVSVEKSCKEENKPINDDEYKIELLKKLIEEARELLETPNIEERADIAEILKSIDGIYAFSQSDIESVRVEKLHKRGGFSKKIFLEKTKN